MNKVFQCPLSRKLLCYMLKIKLLLFAVLFTSWSPLKMPSAIDRHFDFNEFEIQKGRLGKIKLGMTIPEAEKYLSGLSKQRSEAVFFGFGGGSPAYLYYWKDEIILGLIPRLDTDTLLFIVAAHEKLRTANGLSSKSTVRELMQKYADLTVRQDLMNQWEYFRDEENSWDFIFMTAEKTMVGEYRDIGKPSKPKKLHTKTDWITIR